MIPTPDPNCNRVIMTASPDVTLRCTQGEGHVEPCDIWQTSAVVHKHRAPVETVTTPSYYVGAHRAPFTREFDSAANHVDAALRRQREMSLRVAGVLA